MGRMDDRELAKGFAQQLRWYMREKTPNNDLVAIPMMSLMAGASASKRIPRMTFTPDLLQDIAQLLEQAGLCRIVTQQQPAGPPILCLEMTAECREIGDEQIVRRLFPERS
jgi:hypothetical protein